MRALILLSSLLWGACKPPPENEDETPETPENPTCTTQVEEPRPSGDRVSYLSSFTLMFTSDDDAPTLVLTTAQGAEVAADVSPVDGGLKLTPDEPLTPSTDYTLTLTACDEPYAFALRTDDLGNPVSDPSSLSGGVWSVALAEGTFVEPAGLGEIVGPMLDGIELLIGVSAWDEATATLSMLGALGDGSGGQDMCSPSLVIPEPADFSANPAFSVAGEEMVFEVEGTTIVLKRLLFSGALSADGGRMGGMRLEGSIDTRDVDLTALGLGDLCELVQILGVSCQECGAPNPGEACLSVVVEDLTAQAVDGDPLVVRSTSEVASDPSCGE